jgi:hypothetical protein
MNIPDHISESSETIFWAKILKFFDADADPGFLLTLDPRSWMGKIRIRDKHPGSATLAQVRKMRLKQKVRYLFRKYLRMSGSEERTWKQRLLAFYSNLK